MSVKWFRMLRLVISVSCYSSDWVWTQQQTQSLVLGPLLSLKQLCDRGNFTWFDCSLVHYLCGAGWNMKLVLCTPSVFLGWTMNVSSKMKEIVITHWCAWLCPTMLNETRSVSPSLSFFLSFFLLIDNWPFKGIPWCPSSSTISAPSHIHMRTTKYVDFCQLKPHQLFASC